MWGHRGVLKGSAAAGWVRLCHSRVCCCEGDGRRLAGTFTAGWLVLQGDGGVGGQDQGPGPHLQTGSAAVHLPGNRCAWQPCRGALHLEPRWAAHAPAGAAGRLRTSGRHRWPCSACLSLLWDAGQALLDLLVPALYCITHLYRTVPHPARPHSVQAGAGTSPSGASSSSPPCCCPASSRWSPSTSSAPACCARCPTACRWALRAVREGGRALPGGPVHAVGAGGGGGGEVGGVGPVREGAAGAAGAAPGKRGAHLVACAASPCRHPAPLLRVAIQRRCPVPPAPRRQAARHWLRPHCLAPLPLRPPPLCLQPRNRLDIYLPRKEWRQRGPRPTVIFVTGGAWTIGYKGGGLPCQAGCLAGGLAGGRPAGWPAGWSQHPALLASGWRRRTGRTHEKLPAACRPLLITAPASCP